MIIRPGEEDHSKREEVEFLDALVNHFSDGQAGLSDLDPKVVSELKEELAKGTYFGQDMKHLWLILEKGLSHAAKLSDGKIDPTGYSGRSNRVQSPVFLLNLACGHCEEGAILSAFFGKTGRPVRQFAMDLRDREIDKARRRYAGTESLFRKAGLPGVREHSSSNTIEFVADDATNLLGYGEIPREFDVIFIRHQNLWHDRMIWRKIYEFALNRIKTETGALVITSYFDREHLMAVELVKTLGGKILFSEQNPRTRELDYPGKSIDRHVAVIGKS